MAELFDIASGSKTCNGTASSPNTVSWTHTPTNTPNAVVVEISWQQTPTSPGNIDITGVTYGGVAMTALAETSTNNHILETWTLLSPPAGAQTVAVTWQNDDGVSTSVGVANSTTFYSNAGGTATFSGLVTNTGTGSPVTATSTGVSANNVFANSYCVYRDALTATTIAAGGTGETERSGETLYTPAIVTRAYNGSATQTSANGNVVAAETISASRDWCISMLEIREITSQIKKVSSVVRASIKKMNSVALASIKKIASIS